MENNKNLNKKLLELQKVGEEWRDIKGYEGYYMVSNFGRIFSIERKIRKWDGMRTLKGGVLKPSTNLRGYSFVYLYKDGASKMKTIHRLVAESFIPNPKHLPQINHKDEDKKNNHIGNPEWCSAHYNVTYGNRISKMVSALGFPVIAYFLESGTEKRFDNYQQAADAIGVSRATICRHAQTGRPLQKRVLIRQVI